MKMSNIKQRRVAIPLFVAFVLTINYLYAHLVVITSPSLKHRFFWKCDGLSQKGDYISFRFSHPLIEEGEVSLTKRIACVEGDNLRLEGRTFYCNDIFVGTAKEKSMKGKPLPLFQFSGQVPAGKLFMTGDTVDSFDSRYWGFIDRSISYQRLTPLSLSGI